MKYQLAIIFFALLSASTTLASSATPGIYARVKLFPVGSFDLTSPVMEGRLQQLGDRFTASELAVPVSSLETGISLRNRHMRERLNEEEHPRVLVTEVAAKNGKGTAQLTIGGVSQAIDFKMKILNESLAEVRFDISLPDFKISGISYMGVGVEDDLELIAVVPYFTE